MTVLIKETIDNAINGDAEAQFNVGNMYFYGEKQDLERAIEWWGNAAKQGHIKSQAILDNLTTQLENYHGPDKI